MNIMSILLKPFALLLGFLYSVTGSYGLAIILFALIFKVILFPISIKGRKGMLDMSRLSERQKELQQKYGRDRVKYSEELQNLYVSENVKPSSGCLWSFVPLPVLIALYAIISKPFTHILNLKAEQVSQLTSFIDGQVTGRNNELSIAQRVYENFGQVKAGLPEVANQIEQAGGPINFDFFGINLSATPDFLFYRQPDAMSWPQIGLFLIPIVSAVLAFFSMKVNMAINKRILGTGATQQDNVNRQMLIMQPLISLWLGFTLPAALGLYWTANSIFAILQEYCSIGVLRTHVARMKEAAEQRAIEQKEKLKEQKRLAAEQKKKKAEEARRIKMERNVSTDGISESRVGIRAYAKGRTYDPDRYPVTAYHDPDDIIKEQSAAKAAPSEAAAQQPKKKKKGKEEDKPQGLILNGVGEREPVPTEADDYEPLTEDVAEEILADEDLDDVPDSEDEKID